MIRLAVVLSLAILCGCLSHAAWAVDGQCEGAAAFDRFADSYLDFGFKEHPSSATELGVHDYDGQMEDFSAAAVENRIKGLKDMAAGLEQIKVADLDKTRRLDAQLLKNDIGANLLELEQVQMWRKYPDQYSSSCTASVFALMKRNFAPLEERLKSVISREKQIPACLKAARQNLSNPPRIYTEIALEQMPGIVDFFKKSVPEAFKSVTDEKLQSELAEVNAQAVAELAAYERFLKDDLLPRSTGQFALGEKLYSQKLLLEEMVDTPIDALLARGETELRRLQAEFEATARQIDRERPPRVVFESLSSDHPAASRLITSVSGVLEDIRKFCVDKEIVTIPSEERVKVDETPPFARALSFASMDTPGPFETKAREAYYFVTLPEPTWTKTKAEEHMRAFSTYDLLNTSVHEAYPGHYVQFLWVPHVPSKVRKVIGCGSNAEGWAHYCEQMMVDEGFEGGNPRLKLMQLHDALLRACRYICGIRMHTRGMTLAQSIKFFMDEGYQEKANAERESKRGTMNPTYLVYTLGKLDILALRDDYRKAAGDKYSLKDFHDRFLAQGFPPLKIVRAALLDNADPPSTRPLAAR